ncbi:PREDICTED: uncharacterized protein LOC105116094, partial [Populus euphratica]|uniref:Uncharacterized protein LOC105116094 n=1 Tax=Populus euphratica TaxID=75702 RepID=A0AAJ6TIQ8_POPEU
LSQDDSRAETASPYPLKSSPSPVPSGAEEDEKDWFFLVQTLLTTAGLDSDLQLDSFFAGGHSPGSPLDSSLRDKYANLNDKELLLEAKPRSNGKLVFDSVNAALVEITGHGSGRSTKAVTCSGVQNWLVEGAQPRIIDYVWAQLKSWFCSDMRRTFGDGGDSNSLVVEMVVGKGWVDKMRVELDSLGNEIEGKLLDELVEEAVLDLTDKSAGLADKRFKSTCIIHWFDHQRAKMGLYCLVRDCWRSYYSYDSTVLLVRFQEKVSVLRCVYD